MMHPMEALRPPNTHYLSAAEGWLELGNAAEARAELARIDESLQKHPTVLEVRWALCAHESDWTKALGIANELLLLAPDAPFAWLHSAYAVRRVQGGGLEAAWNALFPALEKFPDVPIIPYNLACYACQLQRLDTARELIRRAIEVGGKSQIQKIALADEDLKPLWGEIKGLH